MQSKHIYVCIYIYMSRTYKTEKKNEKPHPYHNLKIHATFAVCIIFKKEKRVRDVFLGHGYHHFLCTHT